MNIASWIVLILVILMMIIGIKTFFFKSVGAKKRDMFGNKIDKKSASCCDTGDSTEPEHKHQRGIAAAETTSTTCPHCHPAE